MIDSDLERDHKIQKNEQIFEEIFMRPTVAYAGNLAARPKNLVFGLIPCFVRLIFFYLFFYVENFFFELRKWYKQKRGYNTTLALRRHGVKRWREGQPKINVVECWKLKPGRRAAKNKFCWMLKIETGREGKPKINFVECWKLKPGEKGSQT